MKILSFILFVVLLLSSIFEFYSFIQFISLFDYWPLKEKLGMIIHLNIPILFSLSLSSFFLTLFIKQKP